MQEKIWSPYRYGCLGCHRRPRAKWARIEAIQRAQARYGFRRRSAQRIAHSFRLCLSCATGRPVKGEY